MRWLELIIHSSVKYVCNKHERGCLSNQKLKLLLLRERKFSPLERKYREVGNKVLDKDAETNLMSNYNYYSGFLLV